MSITPLRRFRGALPCTMCATAAAMLLSACGGQPALTGTGGGTTGSSGDNVLLTEALSYQGKVSGSVYDSQSTRASSSTGAAQGTPPSIDVDNTCVRVHDLEGKMLFDLSGRPIEEVPVRPDGGFSLDNLPVGTDFTLCVDEGKNGSCEVESCVNIPADENGVAGNLNDVRVDPLTTIILAKLRRIVVEKGINPRDLPISPATIVARIVEAYTHLFEESGLDETITLEDIEAVTRAELGALFDNAIPPQA